MSSLATMVCVHAHPDDEAFFGAGATAHYAALGHRVVLITCTSGQLGYDARGLSGDQEGHDEMQTRATRAQELQRSAETLGVARVVTLGYDDSGMMGWPQNQNPHAFMNANVDAVARTIASLFDEEDAKVIVTYDENGFYGHPDHIQAHRVAWRAHQLAGAGAFYATAAPDFPGVTTRVDASAYLDAKLAAMRAHATQITVSPPYFALSNNIRQEALGVECYTLLAGADVLATQ